MSKIGGSGKRKGSGFEREVCVQLSRWVSHQTREDIFWRSAMSGGRATVAFNKGKLLAKQAGDISAIDPLGHQLTDRFCVECKFYKSLEIRSFFLLGKGKLAQFWRETLEDASRHSLMPMLIAKENNTPTLMLTKLTQLNQITQPIGRMSMVGDIEVRLFKDVLAQEFIG